MSGGDVFGLPARHEWPLVLQYGALVLRPMRWRDAGPLRELRARNRGWTEPWDATSPDGLAMPVMSASQLVRAQREAGRQGTQLSWLLAWDDRWPQVGPSVQKAPVIGQITVSNIAYGCARNATIGYWIDKGHAGRGLMPTAVAMAGDYCFDVLRLHRLEICLRPENRPSRRVVEKLGFSFEGTRRRYLHIDGDWRDHSVYVMTDEQRPVGGLVRALTAGVAPRTAPGQRTGESDVNG